MSKNLVAAICEHLGLDPHLVIGFELKAEANELPIVTLEVIILPVSLDENDNFLTEVERYQLTRLDT